ncbi:hypothetical protein BC332_28298 [Capsicum chinense]|nr:hypothetical protein BC332_28298 [Capsicum chinense]
MLRKIACNSREELLFSAPFSSDGICHFLPSHTKSPLWLLTRLNLLIQKRRTVTSEHSIQYSVRCSRITMSSILDSIQLSIRNVHVLYRDMLTYSGKSICMLMFLDPVYMFLTLPKSKANSYGSRLCMSFCLLVLSSLQLLILNKCGLPRLLNKSLKELNHKRYWLSNLLMKHVTVFGLKLSSLTITRQLVSGKLRDGSVNKLVEVKGLELYCNPFQSSHEVMRDDAVDSNSQSRELEANNDRCILVPLDVSLSLSVNRLGRLERDVPQYFISVESNNVVVSLDEIQIQQILSICDYFLTCQLREKYGRFRPWWSPLGKKIKGWQIAWWKYAQQSVLLDVQQRLRRTSWKYLGERLLWEQSKSYFKFENWWLNSEGFVDRVNNWWNDFASSGKPNYILAWKLKALKGKLKELGGKSYDITQRKTSSSTWFDWVESSKLHLRRMIHSRATLGWLVKRLRDASDVRGKTFKSWRGRDLVTYLYFSLKFNKYGRFISMIAVKLMVHPEQ